MWGGDNLHSYVPMYAYMCVYVIGEGGGGRWRLGLACSECNNVGIAKDGSWPEFGIEIPTNNAWLDAPSAPRASAVGARTDFGPKQTNHTPQGVLPFLSFVSFPADLPPPISQHRHHNGGNPTVTRKWAATAIRDQQPTSRQIDSSMDPRAKLDRFKERAHTHTHTHTHTHNNHSN